MQSARFRKNYGAWILNAISLPISIIPQQLFGIFEGFMLEAAMKHGEQARLCLSLLLQRRRGLPRAVPVLEIDIKVENKSAGSNNRAEEDLMCPFPPCLSDSRAPTTPCIEDLNKGGMSHDTRRLVPTPLFTLPEKVLLLLFVSYPVRLSIVPPLGFDALRWMSLGRALGFEKRIR
jgi:hypothetical protein